MDYNFISVDEFRELDESGLLLESGTYDGRSDLLTSFISRPLFIKKQHKNFNQLQHHYVQSKVFLLNFFGFAVFLNFDPCSFSSTCFVFNSCYKVIIFM